MNPPQPEYSACLFRNKSSKRILHNFNAAYNIWFTKRNKMFCKSNIFKNKFSDHFWESIIFIKTGSRVMGYSSCHGNWLCLHYNDIIMGTIASQITSITIVYSTVYSDADQRKHQSSASLAFVRGIHRGPLNSPHKWPVTRKMLPFDDVIMLQWCGNIFVVLMEHGSILQNW